MGIYKLDQAEIDKAFEGTNFGNGFTNKERVYGGLLKAACEYYNGYTMHCILKELGLINEKGDTTAKGRSLLYDYFKTK